MNCTAFTQTFSARFFAVVTIASLLLSALPASVLVAYAARTGVDVTSVAGTAADIGVNILLNAEVLNDGDNADTASIVLTDGGQGGTFTNASGNNCSSDLGTSPQSLTVNSGTNNKRFCYRNTTAGTYEISVQAQVASVDVGGLDTISVTVNALPEPITPTVILDPLNSVYEPGDTLMISGSGVNDEDGLQNRNLVGNIRAGATCEGGFVPNTPTTDFIESAIVSDNTFTYGAGVQLPNDLPAGIYSYEVWFWHTNPTQLLAESECRSFKVDGDIETDDTGNGGGNEDGSEHQDGTQITICHATGSESNPYLTQGISASSILNPSGHGNSGVNESDIIPPFEGFEGQNWNPETQAIYNNECKKTEIVEPSVTVPLTVCKYEGINDTLSGWNIRVYNDVSEYPLMTEGDGCVEIALDPFLGPWYVTEENRTGWKQSKVYADGPGSSVRLIEAETSTLEGCYLSRPLIDEEVPEGTVQSGESESGDYDSVDQFGGGIIELPPVWQCDFYNEQDDRYQVSGYIWEDRNEDDVRTEDEPGLSDWTVTATNIETNEVIVTESFENGEYEIDLPAGTWRIAQQIVLGWTQLSLADGDGAYVVTVPFPEKAEESLVVMVHDWFIPTAHAEVLGGYITGLDFGNKAIETFSAVPNTCLIPHTLGETNDINILDSGEKSITAMMTEDGYLIDVIADETNIQVWDVADPMAETITFNLRVVGKRAGNTQVLGYYKAGDGATYSAVLTQVSDTDGEVSIPVTIPAAFASSFGFAIQSGGKTWFTEKGLNDDDFDHAAVYNPVANTYLVAFEDFDGLGDSDYNDMVIEISDVTCVSADEHDAPVVNQCVLPDTLGNESIFEIGAAGEKTIAEMMAEHGYIIDPINDQVNYQVWNVVDPGTDSVSFDIKVLGKRAGNTQVLGYYKAGDSLTFTSVLTQISDTDGEVSVPVTIPATFASSFGFAIESGGNTWYSETALNSDGLDHVAVYNPVADTYLLAFEDTDGLGDADYNDLVIEFSKVACVAVPTTSGGGGEGEENEEFQTSSSRGGSSSGGRRSPRQTDPSPRVLGESTSLPDAPVGQVLGEQVSAVPYGAPNAGAGSTSTAGLTFMNIMFVNRLRDVTPCTK